jgi:hypothetical protein
MDVFKPKPTYQPFTFGGFTKIVVEIHHWKGITFTKHIETELISRQGQIKFVGGIGHRKLPYIDFIFRGKYAMSGYHFPKFNRLKLNSLWQCVEGLPPFS